MWIKTQRNNLVNLNQITGMYIMKIEDFFMVRATENFYHPGVESQGTWDIGEFDSREEAINYINQIYEEIINER